MQEDQHVKPCQKPAKTLPSATAPAATDLLKEVAIVADATVRRCAVDRDDLKPY